MLLTLHLGGAGGGLDMLLACGGGDIESDEYKAAGRRLMRRAR